MMTGDHGDWLRASLTRSRMNHLLATCRILFAMAALAMVLAGGVVALERAGAAGDQESSHLHDHVSGPAHHAATHQAGESCCHGEGSAQDCAGACAAMAGCQLQVMPCDGLVAFMSRGIAAIAGKSAFLAEFTISPATPPPKARV